MSLNRFINELKSELKVCYFSLFDNCNVKCNMCDCWVRPKTSLRPNHYQDALNRVLSVQPAMIRFTGGEPMLLSSLPELVAQANLAGVETSVITNGRIAQHKITALREAGLDLLVVSLDGLGNTHDLIRGVRGLERKVSQTLTECARTETPFAINTVVQKINGSGLVELAKYLANKLEVKPIYWHLIPVRGEPDLIPSGVKYAEALEALQEAISIATDAGIHCIYDYEFSFDQENSVSCTVSQQTMYIRADSGNCYGCNMLAYATEPIGNIFEQSMEEIWLSSRRLKLIDSTCNAQELGCTRCDAGSREMNHWLAQTKDIRKM